MQNRQAIARRRSLWIVFAGAFVFLALVSVGASAAGTNQTKQECIEAALKKPRIEQVGVRHAGHLDGKTQSIFLNARYGAMPEACQEDYYRWSQAKGQVFRLGKWARINDWNPLFGGAILGESTGTGSYEDNQVAYIGRYLSDPPLARTPELFESCRVRILLKEGVIPPHAIHSSHPPHYIAKRIYTVNVPVAQISPRRGHACSLLVPER